MKLNTTTNIYIFLMVAIVISAGMALYFHYELKETGEKIEKQKKQIRNIEIYAQKIHDIQETIRHIGEKTGKEKLNSTKLLQIFTNNNLKSPATLKVTEIKRPTYFEELRTLKLKDEFLEPIIKALQDIESINKTRIRIKNMTMRRNLKDKDLWTADIKISQTNPKKLER